MGDNFGIHRGAARSNTANNATNGNTSASSASTEERTQGQILSDFLLQLEDYTPTVSIGYMYTHYTRMHMANCVR